MPSPAPGPAWRIRLKPILDWARPFYLREALLCLPAMPLLLMAGLVRNQEVAGVVAAGGAFSVGFGASATAPRDGHGVLGQPNRNGISQHTKVCH
jgi:hypothetical protein